MKNRLLLIFTFLVISVSAKAQTTNTTAFPNHAVEHGEAFASMVPQPLYVVESHNKVLVLEKVSGPADKRLSFVDPDWIQSINILKGLEATAQYDSLGKHGVVIINLQSGALAKMPTEIREQFVAKE